MEKIYMLDNSQGVIGLFLGLKSRISPMRPLLTMLALLMVALFGVNENAWGAWPTYSGTITQSGSTYYVLNDGTDRSISASFAGESYTYNLGGPGANLSCYAARSKWEAVGDLKITTYKDGTELTEEYSGNPSGNYSWGFFTSYKDVVTKNGINVNANKLIFSASGGSYSKKFKDVKVTMFSGVLQPSLTSGSWTYTTANYAAADSYKEFAVDWSNLSSLPISIVKNVNSDDLSQFSYTIQSNTQTLGGGKYGTATVRVYYKHDKVGTHSVKVNVGSYSITFTGTTNKITPYIDTKPTVDTITYGQTISNSQLHGGLVKADLINNTGAPVAGTWTIDEAGNTVSTSGGSNATVHLTFTPSDQKTYNVLHTTQTMFVRSASMITWASAYSAEKPTIPVGKTIENAATTTSEATITYSTSDPNIIEIGEGGTSFRAIAEGEATVTASHGVTPTHGAASAEKTFKTTYKDIQVIVWTDRFDRLTTEMTSKNLLAQVWIENPSTGVRTYSAARTALLEYSVEDNTVVSIPNNSTTLTIHKKGNTTITASVEGDDQYEEASVTMPVKVREPSAGCDDPIILKEENNGSSDYLYRLFSGDTKKPALYTDEYAINVAQGQVPDKLSFAHKGEEYKVVGLSIWTYYSGTIKAQQKVNGDWIDVPNSSVAPEKSKWNTIEGLQLNEKATHIRFVRPQGGEGYHYVNNVEVTMKHFIRTATPTVDFGNTIKVNSSEYQDVVVKYSNVKDALQVVNPFTSDVTVQVVNPFTSDVTVSDEVIDVDSCGAFGSATLRISFSPTTATEIDDYIVVKDPIVGNSSALSIRVKADVQRADQTITWNPATSISTIDQILLNGSTNGQEYGQMNVIGYEVTNNDGVISVTNNVVTILKPGTVTITASQPGTANYDVAEPVEKNFTISAEPLTLVAPTASDITYGQALPTLIGGSAKDSKGNDVDGTFAWQNPDAVLNAGNNQTPNVVFTPSTNAAWYTNLTTTANINVTKADPAATVKNVSFAYGTKAEDVALSGTGAGTWTWTDSRKDDVLAAGEYEMDVHFAPTDGDNYNAIDTKITLTVNKIETLQVPVVLSFCAGGSEEYRGETYSEAGTYPVNATGANRDTVYNVIVTVLQPTTGTDSKTITYGENESWHGTNLSGYTAGEYEVEYHTTNAVGCDSTVTLSLTVNKATPTLSWETAPAELAYNATDVVYAATSTSNEGDITYSITSGSEYAEINATTGALTNIVPGHNITVQATQAVSTNYNAPVAITVNVTIAATPTNTFTNAHGDNDWQTAGNWSNGEVPSGENPNVIISGELIVNEDVTVGGLTILPTGSVAVVTNGTLTIKGTSETRSEYGDMHVADDGNVVLGSSADLKVRHFFLDAKLGDSSTQAASGQVKGNGALNVIGDAYFQMKFDPSGAITYGWYDFVVPFEVNITNGISRVGSLDDRIMVSGTDFLVMEDDEAGYVAGGKGWRTMNSGTLLPGRLYTITFNYQSALPQNTFLFEWNKQGNLSNGQTFEAQCLVSADEDRTGWNAIGNGMLCHGYITNGYKVQTYDHTQNKYNVLHQHSTFAIGTAFFVQVAAAGTINWNAAEATNERPLYAPQREMNTVDEFFLTLRDAATEQMADVLFFSASEEATEAYVIGHDLVKRGNPTEAKAAQMWATKNGKKLCDIETALNNNAAIAPLSIFAPNAGQYTLAIEEAPADASLYLTYNGAVIWDLTASPYVFDLTKGTTEGYGLRIEAANAPQVTTDIETVSGERLSINGNRKVIIDNKMYIITPEGAIFDVIGKKVQ